MPVKEPEKSPPGACERAVTAVARMSAEQLDVAMDAAMSTKQFVSQPFFQASNWIKRLGPAGEDLAEDMVDIARFADLMRGHWDLALKDANQYPVKAQEAAYDALWDPKLYPIKELSDDAKKVFDFLEPSFKDSLALAKLYDWVRFVEGIGLQPIKGSGNQAPTILNNDGRKVVADAAKKKRTPDVKKAEVWVTMNNHQQIKKYLEDFTPDEIAQVEQVAMGHTDSDGMGAKVIEAGEAVAAEVDWGFQKLERVHNESVRGVVDYFERTRLVLPDWMRERRPMLALPGHYRKISLMLASSRRWGADFELLVSEIGRIRVENGDPAANIVGDYIFPQLGKAAGTDLPIARAAANALSNYEMLRLFGGTFIGPLRNMGQTFTNAVDTPISAIYRSYKEMPPFMRSVTRLANEDYRRAIRSGAVSPYTPTTEFIGATAAKGAKIHTSVISRNQIRAGVQSYYAGLVNLERVMVMQGDKGPLATFLGQLRHLAVDPEGAHTRALEKSGMPAEKIQSAKDFAEGRSAKEIRGYMEGLEGRLGAKSAETNPWTEGAEPLPAVTKEPTTAELEALLAKPDSEITVNDMLMVMQVGSKRAQFTYDFANKRIKSSLFWRSLMMVKGWGTRMGGYIYDDVMTELMVHKNGKPVAKLLATTFILGELYNLTRDTLTGQEKSMIKRAQAGALTDDDGTWDKSAIAWTALRNVGDGGGLFILMDVLYGWQSLFGGPVGGTMLNALRMTQHIAQDPSFPQAGAALRDFLDKELILTKQWAGAALRFQSLFEKKHERLFKYNTWRDRSYKYLAQEDDPSMGIEVGRGVIRFLEGTGRQNPTPRSLTYEDASQEITNNDVPGAQKDMEYLLRTAKDEDERQSILTGIRTAGRQRSPLGPISAVKRDLMLAPYTGTQQQEALDLQANWLHDWNTAMDEAAYETRGQYRGDN